VLDEVPVAFLRACFVVFSKEWVRAFMNVVQERAFAFVMHILYYKHCLGVAHHLQIMHDPNTCH